MVCQRGRILGATMKVIDTVRVNNLLLDLHIYFLRMTSISILRVLAHFAVADLVEIELFNTDACKERTCQSFFGLFHEYSPCSCVFCRFGRDDLYRPHAWGELEFRRVLVEM
jgi:hypothetical protein